jgi:transcriptional regulator
MYTPAHFAEDRVEVLVALMRAHPLATLVTLGKQGLVASHIPLIYDPLPEPFGTLRGHMAKANPQWRDISRDVQALAIFGGPQHYVTPSWYPSTAEHGKVVPTWNYSVVHASGKLVVQHDGVWLRRNVEELTEANERQSAQPWHVDDAPAEYIDGMLHEIVGVEIVLDKLEGKWKVSQNRPATDRAGVVSGLHELGTSEACEMARLVAERGAKLE